jgi:hypothetical protein
VNPSFPLTLAELSHWLRTLPIEAAYSSLGFSYAEIGASEHSADYARLLEKFAWTTPPNEEVVRRLFNQINSSYADRLVDASEPLAGLLLRANALMLFAEGKHIGLREREIAFGYRKHLDVMDPLRRAKWLRGPPAKDVPTLIARWSEVAHNRRFGIDAALLMALLLVAIHPFTDANGRMARLAFTMLLVRSGEAPLWLNEAEDGELLRTGSGIESTEFLMAALVAELAGNANVIEGDGLCEASAIAPALMERLDALDRGDDTVLTGTAFDRYNSHLEQDGHLLEVSPRFACLRAWLA